MSTAIDRAAPRQFYKFGDHSLSNIASALIIASLIVAFLYIGRDVFEPLALAALLSLVLAPVVKRLRRLGAGKTPSVLVTVLFAMSLLGGLGYVMTMQVADLAGDLPKYESNLREKIRSLGGTYTAPGAFDRASGTLKDLQKEMDSAGSPVETPVGPPAILSPKPPSAADPSRPIPVEVREAPPTPFESVVKFLTPLVQPLGMVALVILFVAFILLQREDLRDRFLRLAGTRDLQRSTAAMNDAAARLGRFLLTQTALNATVGAVMGVCLWLIGIPSPILWGIVAGLMRFVPFFGTFIAAAFPLALAAAVDPGWTMVIATAALFLVVEPIVTNVIEPMIYGRHTGLSPIAVIITTLFWTILWGPVGLLLSTPLTVCLVVLGRHIESLAFLDVLFGDTPALEPEERFYQRVLAGDATEAAEQAEEQLKTQSLSNYYDAVPMKALALAQIDAAGGTLSPEKQREIRDSVEEIVEDLADYDDLPPKEDETDSILDAEDGGETEEKPKIAPDVASDMLPAEWRVANPVLCVASRSPLDEAAGLLLAHLLGKHGLSAHVQPYADAALSKRFKIDAPDARIVCLSYFGATANPVHVRYLIRRLRRIMPRAQFLAGFWLVGDDAARAKDWKEAAGADFVATSLAEATAICVEQALAAGASRGGGTAVEAPPRELAETGAAAANRAAS